jgi:hypothetical protein
LAQCCVDEHRRAALAAYLASLESASGARRGGKPDRRPFAIRSEAGPRAADSAGLADLAVQADAALCCCGFATTWLRADDRYPLEGAGETPPANALAQLPAQLIVKLLSSESAGVTGRLTRAPCDRWRDDAWTTSLRERPSFGRLRRVAGELVVDATYGRVVPSSAQTAR